MHDKELTTKPVTCDVRGRNRTCFDLALEQANKKPQGNTLRLMVLMYITVISFNTQGKCINEPVMAMLLEIELTKQDKKHPIYSFYNFLQYA